MKSANSYDRPLFAHGPGAPATISYYNQQNQLAQQVDPDSVLTAYTYNAKGECVLTALDPSGFNRLTFTTNDVTFYNGANVRRTRTFVWSTSGSSSNLISTVQSSVEGLQSWNTVWNGFVPTTSQSATVYAGSGLRYLTNSAPDGSYALSVYQNGRLMSLTQYDGSTAHNQIGQTAYTYDPHGRQNTATDARNGTTTCYFNNADQVNGTVSPRPGSGQAVQITTNYFDRMGRIIATTLPDNTSVTNVFYPSGLLQLTYGSRTYPVGYTYDAQGRIQTMTTWQNYSAGSGAATTTWNYDQYRGWLASKTYNGNVAGPAYTYTPAGRLQTRQWARNVTTTYTYNTAGDLRTVAYSDTTNGLTYTYDRRGRPATVTDATGAATTLAFNDASQLLSEAYSGASPLAGLTVASAYDQYLRRYNLSLNTQPSALNITYGFDAASRLQTVTDGADYSATYTYLANSPLVSQVSFANSYMTVMTTAKQYDYVNRLTQISLSPSFEGPLLSFSYGYNSANQRTNDTLVDSSYWVYGYDALGQVVSGKKYWSDGTPVSGQQFQYQFDNIGNRQGTDAGGDDLGANLHHAVYTPDGGGLNQYASRGVPGYVQTLGTASTNANVAVWAANQSYGQAVRKGTYFRAELAVNNAGSPQWVALTNVALKPGGSSADVVANAAGNVFVAKTPEQFGYDPDGNLTNDGRWALTWDAENRLVRMAANTAVGPQQVVTFAYDWRGRRIQKQVSVNGTVTNNTAFVYDGWNPVARLNGTNSALVQSYVWGLDLSGSAQGAGGVGGLLEVSDAVNGVSFVAYDGNGNVAGLVAANGGGSSAVYEYGPFGEVIRATGPMAKANPFRFSTKFQDDETDLLYYGYRYYNASTGRWLSRDPINEPTPPFNAGDYSTSGASGPAAPPPIGQFNYYCFVSNDGINWCLLPRICGYSGIRNGGCQGRS